MSLYEKATIGTSTNQVVFNDTTAKPYFRVQSRAPQRRDIRELDIPIPYESGIADYRTYIGETNYVIRGTMYPGSELESDSGLEKLRKLASLDYSQSDTNADDGYVPYLWQEALRKKQLFVKVLYVNVTDNTRQGLIKDFEIYCKIKDPTIYSEEQVFTTIEADPTGTTGSAVYSFEYPIAYGASYYSVSSDAYNYGDVAVYPLGINVYGPVTNPVVVNAGTGEHIGFTGVTLSNSSNMLSISYDKDSLSVTQDGNSIFSKVTGDSTYFKLRPGSNLLTLTGSSISTGAYLTMTFRSGWPLG
jgi:hypothetical protein